MFLRLVIGIFVLVQIAACSTSKKASQNVQQLDEIELTFPKDNPYRASATKDFALEHTRLEVSFDYANRYLFGKAQLTLQPHFYPQNTLVLDAKQFDLKRIYLLEQSGKETPLNFTYDSLQIIITLPRTYAAGEKLKVGIDYTAKPEERKTGGSAAITEDKGLYFINHDGKDSLKPIQIWTQGETESSSCWFPTIDKPNQKTTQEIYITRLKKYKSLSNGVLVSTKENVDGTETDCWKMNLPHAPYLFMMAIGDFVVTKDRWRDVEVTYYTEPEYAPYAKEIFGNTPEMMEFFSQKLGFDYPWSKYAQVVVRDYVSGAMENTSATLHGEFVQRTSRQRIDETYEDIISHELIHQWFGDLVTTESWSNIPLNESFATYGEYLWDEYKYGQLYADNKLYENYQNYMQEAENKNVDLVRFYYDQREDMFDRHSYDKGGFLLHYLRNIVGDAAFFKSIELYLKTNQFKAVEIHQLRLAFEEVTGKDMNWFFNQWFLNAGHPKLKIDYSYNTDSVFVKIEQTHNIDKGLVYTLPFQIDVWHGKEVKSYPVELNKKQQTFAFAVASKPNLIDVDAKRVVLCEKTENKTTAEYIFQYNNTPRFIQRLEALMYLEEAQKKDSLAASTLLAATGDLSSDLRQLAIELFDLNKSNEDVALPVFERLATQDKNSHVRNLAIKKLSKSNKATSYELLFENATKDSSYLVTAEGLKSLKVVNSKKAMEIAKRMENEKVYDLVTAIADVYSTEGDDTYQSFFEQKISSATGYSKFSLLYYYANFLLRMDKPIVLSGIKAIEAEGAKDDGNFITSAARGALKRMVKSFEEKKKKAQSDMSVEQGQTAKLALQEKINDYEQLVGAANDAMARLPKKAH
jgi:aminopeptidase N